MPNLSTSASTAAAPSTATTQATSTGTVTANQIHPGNFFFLTSAGADLVLYFARVTNVVWITSTNTFNYNYLTVANLSGITGVGAGATQIDATDIILF